MVIFQAAPRIVTKDLYQHLTEKCQFFPENVKLDGINFYHAQSLYTPGDSPLVLWLKPFMIPEILQKPVHELLAQLHKPSNYVNLFEYTLGLKKNCKKNKNKNNSSFNCDKMEVDNLVEVSRIDNV